MQILKMSVLENFLLEFMKFLFQNEAGVMYYSSTSDLESNDAKSGTVPYGCGPLWVQYPLGRGYHSKALPKLSIMKKTVLKIIQK